MAEIVSRPAACGNRPHDCGGQIPIYAWFCPADRCAASKTNGRTMIVHPRFHLDHPAQPPRCDTGKVYLCSVVDHLPRATTGRAKYRLLLTVARPAPAHAPPRPRLQAATTPTLRCGKAGRDRFVIQCMKVVPLIQPALLKCFNQAATKSSIGYNSDHCTTAQNVLKSTA